jgi:hypothetical protein
MPLVKLETSMEVLFATSKVWVLNSLPSILKIFTFRFPAVFCAVIKSSFFAGLGWMENLEISKLSLDNN